jgi:hypothetical protein
MAEQSDGLSTGNIFMSRAEHTANVGAVSTDQLVELIERIERLELKKAAVAERVNDFETLTLGI